MSKRSHGDTETDGQDLPGPSSEGSLASCSREDYNLSPEPPNKRVKKQVAFKDVTVFYFTRAQGFICVPSQGGSSLGMSTQHISQKHFTIQEHLDEKRRAHLEMIKNRRKLLAAVSALESNSPIHPDGSNGSESEESEVMSEESEVEVEEEYMFLQPLPTHQRRALLRESGVRKIDSHEKEDCRYIRASREVCGCECRVFCDPDTCHCSLAGIKCQVDRSSFPCGCTNEGCQNLSGRIEFNPFRVHSHFIRTIMRLKLEAEQNQEDNKTADLVDSLYARPTTSKNGAGNFNLDCSTLLQSALLKKAASSLKSSGANSFSNNSLLKEDAQALLFSLKDKKLSTSDMYKSQFSPEDSSYSESSDYNSDDLLDSNNKLPAEKLDPSQHLSIDDNSPCLQDSIDSNQLEDDSDGESTLIANDTSFSSTCSSQSIHTNEKIDDVTDVMDILVNRSLVDSEVVLS